MTSSLPQVADILLEIEREMRSANLWQRRPPSKEAFTSAQPFCVDTMYFYEWMQWVFLPRMKQIVEEDLPLPQNSAIFPMAEEAFRQDIDNVRGLMKAIDAFDRLIASLNNI